MSGARGRKRLARAFAQAATEEAAGLK